MSEHTPTLDEVRDCYATGAPCGEDLRQRLEQKFRDDYAEFDRWLTQVRAEAVSEFAKQHGIGDATSRPLYDAQQRIAYLELEVGWLRRENRRLEEQAATAQAEALREAADAFEGGTIDATFFGDSPEARWWEGVSAARKGLITSLRDRAAKLGAK